MDLNNEENSQRYHGVVIDSAACVICMPSMKIEPSNEDPQEEMQDAPSAPRPRRSARARKVVSSSEEEMPLQRSASRAAKRGRGTSRKQGSARTASRKPSSRGRSRSRSRSARKSSVSRRGRRV